MITDKMTGLSWRSGWRWRLSAVFLRGNWERGVTLFLFAAGIVAAALTLLEMLTGTGANLGALLLADFSLMLMALALLVARAARFWLWRRGHGHVSRIYSRVVMLFGFLAAIPAIAVAIFAVLFLDIAMRKVFSGPGQAAVSRAVDVASAYIEEHRATIRADVLLLANSLEQNAFAPLPDTGRIERELRLLARLRGLSEAMVIGPDRNVLLQLRPSLLMGFERIPDWAIAQANRGEVVILSPPSDDRIRALVKLRSPAGAYLYIGRFVDAKALEYFRDSQEALDAYNRLSQQTREIELTFATIFSLLSFMLLLSGSAFGLSLAGSLIEPLQTVARAADQLRRGENPGPIEDPAGDPDISTMVRVFNRMTDEIASRERALRQANAWIDERRQIMEAILNGVSAGVIGVDENGRIDLINPQARNLLGLSGKEWAPLLAGVAPEFTGLAAGEDGGSPLSSQVTLRRGGRHITCIAHVSRRRTPGGGGGLVITFDDVTALLQAQQDAAWSDVARRIAHEIRNPLTPIQLAAERLHRKYAGEITSDPLLFRRLLNAIIDQVENIGRMVREFSDFARAPRICLQRENLPDIIRQAVYPQQFSSPEIAYVTEPFPDTPVMCDRRQIIQVLVNLFRNAAEAIAAGLGAGGDPARNVIRISVHRSKGVVRISVADTGIGLPGKHRDRLAEPYFTTSSRGAGLGLAIARRIMEEHGGTLETGDNPGGGAVVTISLPVAPADGERRKLPAPAGA